MLLVYFAKNTSEAPAGVLDTVPAPGSKSVVAAKLPNTSKFLSASFSQLFIVTAGNTVVEMYAPAEVYLVMKESTEPTLVLVSVPAPGSKSTEAL